MGGPVERAYLVSVEDLRDICTALAEGKREYKLTREDEKKVTIFYSAGPDDLNALCFTFPIIANFYVSRFLPVRLEEGVLMVCLHVSTGKPVRGGFILKETNFGRTSLRIGKSSGSAGRCVD